MYKYLFLLFLFIPLPYVSAQSENKLPVQELAFSLEGGVNIGFTDYLTKKPGLALRSGLEYYFYPHSDHRIGIGFQFGYQKLGGEDDRGTILTKDGIRPLPPSFSTQIFSPGFFSDYSYLVTDRFSASVRLGFTYNVFTPKDDDGTDALGYREGLYNKEFFTVVPEAGLKFRVSDNIDLSLSANLAVPVTDYLDDLSAADGKDTYVNILLGFSYSFLKGPAVNGLSILNGLSEKNGRDISREPGEIPPVLTETQAKELKTDSVSIQKPVKDIIDEVVQLKSVNEIFLPGDETFQNGSAKFLSSIYTELDRIVGLINKDPSSRWRIEGHMDSQGVVSAIKKISHDRARAVFDYLVSKGIDAGRLRVYGLADNFPIGNNNTPEGRRMNRRIMIIKE